MIASELAIYGWHCRGARQRQDGPTAACRRSTAAVCQHLATRSTCAFPSLGPTGDLTSKTRLDRWPQAKNGTRCRHRSSGHLARLSRRDGCLGAGLMPLLRKSDSLGRTHLSYHITAYRKVLKTGLEHLDVGSAMSESCLIHVQ